MLLTSIIVGFVHDHMPGKTGFFLFDEVVTIAVVLVVLKVGNFREDHISSFVRGLNAPLK